MIERCCDCGVSVLGMVDKRLDDVDVVGVVLVRVTVRNERGGSSKLGSLASAWFYAVIARLMWR